MKNRVCHLSSVVMSTLTIDDGNMETKKSILWSLVENLTVCISWPFFFFFFNPSYHVLPPVWVYNPHPQQRIPSEGGLPGTGESNRYNCLSFTFTESSHKGAKTIFNKLEY